MPSKSLTSVPRLTQTMRAFQRHISGSTLLAKRDDTLGLGNKLKTAWPQREDAYAATQLMRQNRDWKNYRKYGSSHTTTHKAFTPQRNYNSKNQATKRTNKVPEDASTTIDDSADDGYQRVVGTVRDLVFGEQEEDDVHEKQLKADAKLLKRVVKHTRPTVSDQSISNKVLAPYGTYQTHRNNWAEFRHRMIFNVRKF